MTRRADGKAAAGDAAMTALVGDIGGTQARFRCVGRDGGPWQVLDEMRFASDRCASLEAAAERALAAISPRRRAVLQGAWLAVAGPVIRGRGRLTNLGWEVDADRLALAVGLPQVRIVNDLEALAAGVAALDGDQLLHLQEGRVDEDAMHVVIAVGTGLGVAAWRRRGDDIEIFPSEGGHADLAPTHAREVALLEHLRVRHGHASFERVLSGSGLVALHDFVRSSGRDDGAGDVRSVLAPAAITQLARERADPHAVHAVAMFLELLAGFAANTALQWCAHGGVYLAGGVVDAMVQPLRTHGRFLERFRDKGRMAPLLAGLRVSVALTPDPGLEGITLMARRALEPR